MKKTYQNVLIIAVLIVILGAAYNYSVDHTPAQTGKSLTTLASTIVEASLEEDWDLARTTFQEMKQLWQNRRNLIMLNYAEAEIFNFEQAMAELEGGVRTKDKVTAVSQALVVRDLWTTISSLLPKP